MKELPRTLPQAAKQLPRLRDYLLCAGSEMLEPSNPYEVIRFRAHGKTYLLYRKDSDVLTWNDDIRAVWQRFLRNEPWAATAKTERNRRHRDITVKALLVRDGSDCFFCLDSMEPGEETIEHLVPRAHGGPNHVSNYVLAHQPCNADAGHTSAMEKIKIREANRERKSNDAC